MKRFLFVALASLLCGTGLLIRASSLSTDNTSDSPEVIHFTDISGNYLFIENRGETERMLRSLRDYLGDDSIQIQSSVPEDVTCYAESVWDPSWAAALPGGPVYCVEAWDIFKNGTFQKTVYQVCRI